MPRDVFGTCAPRNSAAASILLVGGAALALARTAPAQPTGGEQCIPGRIVRVTIVVNSLFSARDIAGRRFEPVLQIVNRAHIRTRESYVRRALLFAEGDCFDAEAVTASERLLRELRFIARASASARFHPDSGWSVNVETWDEWSFRASLGLDSERDYRYSGFSLDEDNLLGFGIFGGFFTERTGKRHDRTWSIGTTRLRGTNVVASASGGTTRTGRALRARLDRPTEREAPGLSVAARWDRADNEMWWATGDYAGISHVTVPVADLSADLSVQRRSGTGGRLRVLAWEVRLLNRRTSGSPQEVHGGDFASARPAAAATVAALGHGTRMRSYLTAGAGAGVRRLRFSVARGLDLVSGEQNIALGTEFNAVIGRSLTTFGSGPASTFARIDGFAADTAGPLLAQFALRAEANRADSPIFDGARWHDLAATARVLLYIADRSGGPLTLITGGRLEARTRSTNPWQGTLGGEHGLRGYRIDEIATGSNVSAFAEQRVNLPVIHPSIDLGFAAFGDAGRGWRGDAPLANDTGWRADLGGAIRVGFPAGTGAIARIETAWPIGPERGRGRAFRVTWSSTALSR